MALLIEEVGGSGALVSLGALKTPDYRWLTHHRRPPSAPSSKA